MADERSRTKSELKHLFTNLKNKGINEDMIGILIDVLWRDRITQRTSGFDYAGSYDSVISFDDSTLTFTIKPFDPLVQDFVPRYGIYSYINLAVYHRIYNTLSIEIPNEEGLFCFYFDKEPDPGRHQNLTFVKNPTSAQINSILESKVVISFLYWDAGNNEVIHFGDDRHGSHWNPQIQVYLHQAFGARRKTGLQFTGYSLNGDGSSNDHARFNITGGTIMHDDFDLEIPGSSTSIPVLYSFGTLPRFLANNGYAFAGASRVYYNSGQISLAQADSGNFVLYHIFATNEILTPSRKIISVMGTAQYTTLANAFMGVEPELDGISSYIPMQGRCYLGSIIIQTSDAYTNDKKARIVALTGNETHPPVTIVDASKPYLFINEKQELGINVDALPAGPGGGTDYDFNIHSPEQIIAYLDEPVGIGSVVDGIGTVIATYATGDIVVTAINENGETMGTDVPAFTIYDDTTDATLTWDPVSGATAYRVHVVADELFTETTETEIDLLLFAPVAAGILPAENTAAIYQNPFTINNGDTVEFTGEGIEVITSADGSKKTVLLKKQQSTWDEADENSPNFIPGKPIVLNGREVEMSTFGGYIVWRYVGNEEWINLVSLISLKGLPGDPGAEIELRENAGWLEWRYVGASWEQLYEIPAGGTGNGVKQVTGLSLVVANWVTDGALKKYVLLNANITATSSVEVIPANTSYDILVAAEPMPETESATGTVTMWVKNVPTADIPVTINITGIV